MEIELRPARAEDEGFLQELYAEIDGGELAAAGLPAAVLQPMLAMQYRARPMGYAAQYPRAENSIVWSAGRSLGRVLVNDGTSELRLVDIAILAAERGRGVGSELMRGLCERARSSGVPLRLSVRAGSPAVRLYTRFGFVRTGEDAIDVHMEYRGAGAGEA